MPGLSKVIVLDPDVRAGRQIQLGFEREGVPTATVPADAAAIELPDDDAGLVVVGGVDGQGLALVRRARQLLDQRRIDAPIMFAGRGVERSDAKAAGADEVVLQPAYLRDVVTIGRLLRGLPSRKRAHLTGSLAEVTGVFTLVRALAAIGRSATLTLTRGLRRGEIRFYHGEVTSAQVGMIHGQAALHQLLLWTEARFDFHHEDIVRRHQIPLTREELFADAERFLEGVRDASGGLSPSMVLEPDVQRVQSFGKQIPTEVYGVLRMFDGHRVLADVLEDSAYRVFETLRVAQRAVEAGLLRVVNKLQPRVTWRAILSIEEWLVGDSPEGTSDTGPISTQDSGPATHDQRGKSARNPRRKKKRGPSTPPAIPSGSAPPDQVIDWGALVPRNVGAEVGSLAGVVPAEHISGEIVASAPADVRDSPGVQPKVVFDEAAELTRQAMAEPAEAGADAHALRAVAAAVSPSNEHAHIVDALLLGDTKPEILFGGVKLDEAAMVVDDSATVESGATTARIAATPATGVTDAAVPPSAVVPPYAAEARATAPGAAAAESAPAAITDEPSDGVIRQHIATADTAPVKRRRVPTDPPEDDRPEDAMGEITTPRAQASVEPRHTHSEPSILVSDLAAVHTEVSALANEQAAAPTTVDAASPSREAPVLEARSGAVAFSDVEEEFFRAGHAKAEAVIAAPPIESFDDLDAGYRPVGFWDRLRGKESCGADEPATTDEPPTTDEPATAAEPPTTDEPDP
jgi:DNA-binding response OmpR family regulator